MVTSGYRLCRFGRGDGRLEHLPGARGGALAPAFVIGHSWGTLVALALALVYPEAVRSLILLSGYYYPTLRADVSLFSPPAIPVTGDFLRYTVVPPLTAAMLPAMVKRSFA